MPEKTQLLDSLKPGGLIFTQLITRCALFLKSDWLVDLLFVLVTGAQRALSSVQNKFVFSLDSLSIMFDSRQEHKARRCRKYSEQCP